MENKVLCILTTYFVEQVPYTFVLSTEQWLHLPVINFGNYRCPSAFDILLQTVTKSTWKMLKLI